MIDVRLQVQDDEREVLLVELDGFLELSAALYRQVGHEWDPGQASADASSSVPPDVALVARAREQLTGAGPWQLEGTAAELELLLGRLRAGAELALQRGAQRTPDRRPVAMNTTDRTGTDAQLDILRVSDALMGRLRPPDGG